MATAPAVISPNAASAAPSAAKTNETAAPQRSASQPRRWRLQAAPCLRAVATAAVPRPATRSTAPGQGRRGRRTTDRVEIARAGVEHCRAVSNSESQACGKAAAESPMTSVRPAAIPAPIQPARNARSRWPAPMLVPTMATSGPRSTGARLRVSATAVTGIVNSPSGVRTVNRVVAAPPDAHRARRTRCRIRLSRAARRSIRRSHPIRARRVAC